jgi:hypothetical protein
LRIPGLSFLDHRLYYDGTCRLCALPGLSLAESSTLLPWQQAGLTR